MNKKLIIAIIAVALVAVVALLSKCSKNGGVEMPVAKVKRGKLIVTVSASGTLRSNNEAKLTTVSSGKIENIYVDENDTVKKGELLLELDSSKQAQKDYRRMASLGEKGYVAPQQVELSRVQMMNTLIKAPFDGTIAKKFVEPGEILMGGTPAFLLADLNDMVLETNIDETDIGQVKIGQKSEIVLDAYKDSKLTGTVQFISRSSLEIKEKGITYLVKIKLDPANLTLRLGMTGNVDINVAEKENVLMAPYTALGEDKDTRFVFILDSKNSIRKKTVTTGLENYDNTEILSGLKENDVVLTSNITKMKEGARVKPKFK